MQPIPGRRGGAAVRHAPQRARHGAVPAHRAGAVPQAAGRRRPRAGLRDQSQLPQRRHLDAAQSRVHDARVLRGLPGLSLPDGPDRGADPRSRAEGARHDEHRLPGHRHRPGHAVRPAHDGAGDPPVQPALPAARARQDGVPQGRRWRRSTSRCSPPTASACCSSKLFEASTESKLVAADLHHRASRPTSRRSPAPTTRTRRSPTGSSCSSPAARWPTASPSSTTPRTRRARFQAQVSAREAGDEEAMYFDEDYLRGDRVRPAADGGRGHRHRPAGDAVHRLAVDPRRDPVPAAEAGDLNGGPP